MLHGLDLQRPTFHTNRTLCLIRIELYELSHACNLQGSLAPLLSGVHYNARALQRGTNTLVKNATGLQQSRSLFQTKRFYENHS